MFNYKKLMNKSDEIVNSLTVKEANDYLSTLDLNNKTHLIIK